MFAGSYLVFPSEASIVGNRMTATGRLRDGIESKGMVIAAKRSRITRLSVDDSYKEPIPSPDFNSRAARMDSPGFEPGAFSLRRRRSATDLRARNSIIRAARL